MNNRAIRLENITKTYPGVVALDHITLEVQTGEIHAIVGENGAGKSTMMKIISGAIEPNEGTVEIFGNSYEKMTPSLSRGLGVELVYQEFNLVPDLSVAENIFLGTVIGTKYRPNMKEIYERSRNVLEYMGVDINPKTKVKELSAAYCQLVEIAKAVSKDVKLLILDEPTASLTVAETEILFRLMRRLKEKGTTILYVSHRMSEIFEMCDRITVFRDGQVIDSMNTSDISREELIRLMVGRNVSETYPPRTQEIGETVLEVKNVCGLGIQNVSFSVGKGEILGFGGLVGSGRTETLRMIFGADKMDSGEIYFKGKKVKIRKPADACDLGIGLVPEDRKNEGVIQTLSIRHNISLTILKRVSHAGFMNFRKEDAILNKHKDALQIKAPSLNQLVKNLSGGNQQKVVLSKWLARECQVLILDEPTRGIDVGAKKEIYQIIRDLASQGVAIIMISSDMPELMGMSDRILVMSEGRQAGILDRSEFGQEAIMELASKEFVS